jgi:acyl-coenzyme A synthetase/AMP-(fatty) acid ligase
LVPESEGKVTEEQIQKWMASRVAKHKWLRGGVAFVEEAPKLASGKITRKILREWSKRDSKMIGQKGGL